MAALQGAPVSQFNNKLLKCYRLFRHRSLLAITKSIHPNPVLSGSIYAKSSTFEAKYTLSWGMGVLDRNILSMIHDAFLLTGVAFARSHHLFPTLVDTSSV